MYVYPNLLNNSFILVVFIGKNRIIRNMIFLLGEYKMKLKKYGIIFFILLFAFSCKKTNLTITEPGPDFFLGKMQNGNWPGVKVDGNNLNINGKDYTFEEPILGVGGIYKDPNGDYIITVPAGDNLGTVGMDEEGKKALDEILDIVGPDNALGAVNGIINSKDPGNLDTDKIIGNADVTEEEKKRIEDLVNGLNNGNHFTNPDVIGPNKP